MIDMNEEIKQIAERLKGLREVLELSIEEVAETCSLSPEQYVALESGTVDISVSILHRISHAYGVELTTLMFGDEPKMNAYFVTRKGKGISVERTKAYKYQSLAACFSKRKADPFMVTVHPKPNGEPIHLNSHDGQEFNYVTSGRMLIHISGKDIVLEEGDSIYFNSGLPHGMKALDGKEVKFLAIIF
jgi:quercetin dioxygenase-like cupin family protein/DNA-binding XRE family transcriptional regulator